MKRMNTKTDIKYILFDLDDTLYPATAGIQSYFNQQISDFVAQELNIDPEEADRLRQDGFLRHGTTLRWLMQERGFSDIERYLTAIHTTDVTEAIPYDPELRDLLQSLPQRKSILTNSIKEHAERVLDRLRIRDLFEHIIDIRDSGYRNKPAPEAFQAALARIDTAPEQILFIDDNPSFMAPFEELGGHVLLMDERRRHTDLGIPSVRNIREIVEYIRSL